MWKNRPVATLAIFAKPPRPGNVKTRLIPDLGATNACRIYRHCLRHTLNIARDSGLQYRLHLSEAGDDSTYSGEEYQLQQGVDLGARMLHALQYQHETFGCPAMVIGSDCIELVPETLRSASEALQEHDLVFVPSIDGGFALIGCKQIHPDLFTGVVCSTDQVLK
ncbi:MAG: rSAM/selenodomain-associated transferase 1, partial [Gammaproteobacteria bacterium]